MLCSSVRGEGFTKALPYLAEVERKNGFGGWMCVSRAGEEFVVDCGLKSLEGFEVVFFVVVVFSPEGGLCLLGVCCCLAVNIFGGEGEAAKEGGFSTCLVRSSLRRVDPRLDLRHPCLVRKIRVRPEEVCSGEGEMLREVLVRRVEEAFLGQHRINLQLDLGRHHRARLDQHPLEVDRSLEEVRVPSVAGLGVQ